MVFAPMLALCIVTAGSGGSLGVRAGVVGEVDGILEELMIAMSIGQTVGWYYNPCAALQQSWVCVSVCLYGTGSVADNYLHQCQHPHAISGPPVSQSPSVPS